MSRSLRLAPRRGSLATRLALPLAAATVALAASSVAVAQEPPPLPNAGETPPAPAAPPPQGYAPPPQAYGPPQGQGQAPPAYGQAAPQGYGPPPNGYPPGYGYGAPPYGPPAPQYYGPPAGPPPPPPPPPERATCCHVSLRVNPFNLLFRRLTFEGEVKLFGPVTLEVEPSWIFGAPEENLDASGFALAGRIGVYPFGTAMRGFWIKAHAGWEGYNAALTHSQADSLPNATIGRKYLSTGIFGAMIGGTSVYGRRAGFAISGGIGIGVATADPVEITAKSNAVNVPDEVAAFYGKTDRIQLLGTLGLGVSF